ncbi:glutamine-rich protein 2 isoform X1 [Polypterus senegalus]|nr:glutamine-rich protein 2 isoform X1 [Polypterus senegalus]
MPAPVSLSDLLRLSIGTPEVGSVNFGALRALLHGILSHLQIQEVTAELRDEDSDLHDRGAHPQPATFHYMERKVADIEKQVAALSGLPSAAELLERSKTASPGDSPVNDMWQLIVMKKKIEANEDGVSKAMALLQEMLCEINELKKSTKRLEQESQRISGQLSQIDLMELKDKLAGVDKCLKQVDGLGTSLNSLQDRMGRYPSPEELDGFINWDVLQETLVNESNKLHEKLKLSTQQTSETQLRAQSSESEASTKGPAPSNETSAIQQQQLPSPPPRPETWESVGQAEVSVSSPFKPQSPLVPSRPVSSAASSGMERYPETVDALRHIGQLKERHESLEERVKRLEDIAADFAEFDTAAVLQQLAKLKEQLKTINDEKHKDGEFLGRIRRDIQQLQAECERLNTTGKRMMDERDQQEQRLKHIYEAVQKLEEKKADKVHVEMEIDVKADKDALEGKVSRMQFDATTEQLNGMFQDLMSKISGQEQDWQKVVEKISNEMECKLNRIELEPVKRQLEERWNAIRKKLQETTVPYNSDDAAGIRKQLVARFHCISCDRPVNMMVPSPHLLTVTSAPGLPHRSNRSYTLHDQEPLRHPFKSERAADTDYSYLVAPRSCGGLHTLTFPHRRYTRLQPPQILQQEEEVAPAPNSIRNKEEIGILGLDGQIYKGRMESQVDPRLEFRLDSRLPTLQPKDDTRRSHEVKQRSSSHKPRSPDGGHEVTARPQSAMAHRSRSASARPRKERPLSSLGHVSEAGIVHSSTDGQAGEGRETLHVRMDVRLGHSAEEEPATAL